MKTFNDLKEKLKALDVPYPTIDVVIGLSYENIGDSEDLFPMDICLQVGYTVAGTDQKTYVSVSIDGAYYWYGVDFNFNSIEGSTYGANFIGYCSYGYGKSEYVENADFPENWSDTNLLHTQKEIGKLLVEFLEFWKPEASHQSGVCFYIESM